MAEGYDVRQVVADPNSPSGRANQPSRQLGLVGVQAPRGGNMSDVGADQRVLAEALKMGGDSLAIYAEKKEEEDKLAGQMAYMEGATELELSKSGRSRTFMEGFKGMKAKTAANEWFLQQSADIDSQWINKPTQEFRGHLQGQFKALTDSLDPNDTETRKLVSGIASEMFTKLVGEHVIKNSEWAKQETSNSFRNTIVSEAAVAQTTGDPSSMIEIWENADELMGNIPEEDKRRSKLGTLRQTLEDGDFTLFDHIGGIDAIRKMNASEEEVDSITNAYKQAQTLNEAKFMSEIGKEEYAIMRDLKATGDTEAALARADELAKAQRRSPQYAGALIGKIQAEKFSQDVTQDEMMTLTNPEYVNDLTKVLLQTEYGQLDTAGSIAAVDTLAAKYNLRPDIAKQAYNQVLAANDAYIGHQKQLINEQVTEQKKIQKQTDRGRTLVNTNFADTTGYSNDEIQNGLKQKRDQIAIAVQQDPSVPQEEKEVEAINRHVAFLRNVAETDEQVKRDFASAVQGSPLDEKGMLRPEAQLAFQYMSSMRDAGLSERKIKEYLGDGYNYMSTAVDYGTGLGSDPKTALATSWNMLENPTEGQTIKTDTTKAYIEYTEKKDKFFDNLEPSVVTAWLGAEGGSQYDDVLSYQVKEAAKNSPDMDAWMKSRINTYAKMNPKASQEAILKMAMKDMSQWEFVMGNMVRPVGTKSVSELMGVDKMPGALVSNKALVTYLADFNDKLWPEGSEERTTWEAFKDLPDTVMDNIMRPTGDFKDVLYGTSEQHQRLKNKIQMIDINSLQNGSMLIQMYADTKHERPVGMPIVIPAKEVGDYYKAKRTKDKLDKKTIKKD